MPPPIVSFQEVVKRFSDGPLILDRLSFEASAGDFITLIGPSGCGKSTILKLIAGLTPITTGRATVAGHPPALTASELAFVFQEPTLLPWLNVRKNVEMPLRLAGRVSAEARTATAHRCLALVGLQDRADYYPRQLSGGQKMRVSIARALSLEPQILLLDEPFGALDEMSRNHLNEELLAIRQRQAWTAFFVTHSVAEAVFLSNRILILGHNPGHLHREVKVDLPYPRTEETRLSPTYARLVAEVSQLLRSVERGPA
jgi:NitT/TauT family transport system ATP-binding protein